MDAYFGWAFISADQLHLFYILFLLKNHVVTLILCNPLVFRTYGLIVLHQWKHKEYINFDW